MNAECLPIGTGQCKCLKGYFGNPYEECKPECTINSHCPFYLACVNEKCIDPCPGTCGLNAECQVVTHNPICSCRRGYTGDPYQACRPIEGKYIIFWVLYIECLYLIVLFKLFCL